ncbi:MAG: tryptophan-rich sensory protein [Novosphingobium sp.]|nr:tryptophan-rich sensory protein [Novosphingobium sp.]
MNIIASKDQLRGTFIRWSLLLVPSFILMGMLSAQFSGSGAGDPWLAGLVKPAIYPPPALFGLVWTILYALMGFALALVLSARGATGRGAAAIVFFVQLALNLAWSPVFFGSHQITGALILIGVLDVAVIVTILLFHKVRPLAAMLLLPYLAWIAFATFLNWELREANPEMDGSDYVSTTTRIEI